MKNKSQQDINRDQSLEKLYQGYNEYNEFFQNIDYNNSAAYDSSSFKRKFIERRINDQKFGVFGNALITLGVIVVVAALLYFFVL